MDQPKKIKTYTKAAKIYNLVAIGLIAISNLVIYQWAVGWENLSGLALFLSLAIFVLFIGAAVIGLIQEKSWVKWLFFGLYGLYIFSAIEGLLNAPPDAFGLLARTRPPLQTIRLTTIALSSLGIILLLQKPSPQD